MGPMNYYKKLRNGYLPALRTNWFMACGHQWANFEMFYWWILEEHAILPNFHVLTISVAAMDQQFVSSF